MRALIGTVHPSFDTQDSALARKSKEVTTDRLSFPYTRNFENRSTVHK